jgi:hypothetical protein
MPHAEHTTRGTSTERVAHCARYFEQHVAEKEDARAGAEHGRGGPGSPQTLHFTQILWARYPFDIINAAGNRAQDAAREHDEILQAHASGDVTATMLAMRKHIESGWTVLKSVR